MSKSSSKSIFTMLILLKWACSALTTICRYNQFTHAYCTLFITKNVKVFTVNYTKTKRIVHGMTEYWKHFSAHFDGVHAFSYNSARSEPIWMKFGALWVHCLPLSMADFGRDPRRSERARQNFVFFLSGKQHTTLPISGPPNFTKYAHKKWISDVVNSFGTEFWKLPHKGSFFKCRFFRQNLQRLATSGPYNSLTYRSMKTHDQIGPLRDVDFPFLRLESTQSHSPGQQTPYKERRPSIRNHWQSHTSSY